MRLTWWECGCLYAQGRHDPRPAPPPWCEAHRAPLGETQERKGGVLVLDLDARRYEWWSSWWSVRPATMQFVAAITPDDRLTAVDLGTVAGGTFRPSGGRRRLVLL